MKSNFKYLVLIIFALLFNSCEKESILLEDNLSETIINASETERGNNLRSFEEEDCGFIDELCIKCPLNAEKLPEHPTLDGTMLIENGGSSGVKFEIDNNFLEIEIGSDIYRIYPTNYFDNSDEFLISTPSANFITTNSTDEFVQSFDLGTRLPSEIDKIYNISNADLAEDRLSISSLLNTFGNEAVVTNLGNGNFRIQLAKTDTDGGSARLLDPCRGVNMAALTKKYVDILGLEVHSNSEQIIRDALEQCTPNGFDPREECLDSKCVVDIALANPLIANSQAAPFQIKLNYINSLLGLTQEEYNQLKNWNQENRDLIDLIYLDLSEENENPYCDDVDCSLKVAYQSIIGVYLNSEEVLTDADIDNTKSFFEELYCDKGGSYLNYVVDNLGACGLQYITLFLREDIPTEDLYTLIEKYKEAYYVYYGAIYGRPLKEELQAEGVTWCDMIEITNVMYEQQLGIETIISTNGGSSSFNINVSPTAGPVLLVFKALGEGFGDALAQSFFLWVADNGIDDFPTAIDNIDVFEVSLAFFKGLIPWKGTTQNIGKHLAIDAAVAAIVVMNRAIEQHPNYSWDQAGNDYASVFVKYVVGDIFGAAFAKYGTPLAVGVIKKFNISINGFFGQKFIYPKMSKWFGGGLKSISISITHQLDDGAVLTIKAYRKVDGLFDDKIIVIGRSQDDRIEPFADELAILLNKPVETIKDWNGWSSNLTPSENIQWTRLKKIEGYTVYDIGLDDRFPNTGQNWETYGDYYGNEVIELFGDIIND